MDPLTHLLTTRLLIGRDRATLIAGMTPDLAFYSTYPLWVLRHGHVRAVLDGGAWPVPPPWRVSSIAPGTVYRSRSALRCCFG